MHALFLNDACFVYKYLKVKYCELGIFKSKKSLICYIRCQTPYHPSCLVFYKTTLSLSIFARLRASAVDLSRDSASLRECGCGGRAAGTPGLPGPAIYPGSAPATGILPAPILCEPPLIWKSSM